MYSLGRERVGTVGGAGADSTQMAEYRVVRAGCGILDSGYTQRNMVSCEQALTSYELTISY